MGGQRMRGREQERERGREAGEEDGELVFDDESEYSYVRAVRRHSFALAALHTLAAPGFNPAFPILPSHSTSLGHVEGLSLHSNPPPPRVSTHPCRGNDRQLKTDPNTARPSTGGEQ